MGMGKIVKDLKCPNPTSVLPLSPEGISFGAKGRMRNAPPEMMENN
jgi:hypothetical protein